MVIENGELMHECSSEHLRLGTARLKQDKEQEYRSAVWCSAADTHLKLLDRTVSGARFLTRGVFECEIAHRRSVAIL